MTAEDLINNAIPPLKPTDTLQNALNWMDKLRVSALPVIEGGKFLGLLTEQQILDEGLEATDIVSKVGHLINAQVEPSQHYFELIKVASTEKVKVVAVVGKDQEYLGVVPIKDTVNIFSQMASVQGPGAIIVLSMEEINYSLAEISRLIEENDVKVLSVHVGYDPIPENSNIRVTIKLNTMDSSRVAATLERFGYNIIATFSSEELQNKDSDRLDLLFRYLDI